MSGLDLVPDEETALKVGMPILEKYYGKELIDRYEPYRVVALRDEWVVMGSSETHQDQGRSPGGTARGGGFPSLSISKKDAKVSRIALSR